MVNIQLFLLLITYLREIFDQLTVAVIVFFFCRRRRRSYAIPTFFHSDLELALIAFVYLQGKEFTQIQTFTFNVNNQKLAVKYYH